MRYKKLVLLLFLTCFSFHSFLLGAKVEKKTEKKKETKKQDEKKLQKETKVETKKEIKKDDRDKDDTETAIKGLDTVSVREPEGNWLLKRIWWEKAQKKYEKIKSVVSKILDKKLPFFQKGSAVERDVLEPFYIEVGLDQGQLQEVIADLFKEIEKEREEDIVLDKKEKDFLTTLNAEKQKVEQLKLDVAGIRKIDNALDYALENLENQINRSRRYEENAWQLFKGIAKELSHKKARELYYKMDALWENVQGIASYLNGAFLRHFDGLVETTKKQTGRIKNIAKDLKKKGVDLEKRFEKMQAQALRDASKDAPQDDRGRVEKEMPGREKSGVETKDEKQQVASDEYDEQEDLEQDNQEVGWFGSIVNTITWPFRKVWGWISSLWG